MVLSKQIRVLDWRTCVLLVEDDDTVYKGTVSDIKEWESYVDYSNRPIKNIIHMDNGLSIILKTKK